MRAKLERVTSEFQYTEQIPLGPDTAEYRLITADGVDTVEAAGRRFLTVEPEALTLLATEAVKDISHFLRPAHLAQLRSILDDPEASGNDRFVAMDLLKNANIASGEVLPMCQDTGTAIVMGTTAEFPKRPDGLIGLQETYGFEAGRENVRPMDLGLAYNALANGDLDTIAAQATDGQIAALKLRLLKDDKNFFPNYALTPVVRKEVLDKHPDLKDTLETVSTKLDDATMQHLNSQVDVEKKTIEVVAGEYLKSIGM